MYSFSPPYIITDNATNGGPYFWINGVVLNSSDFPKLWTQRWMSNPYGDDPHCLAIAAWTHWNEVKPWDDPTCQYKKHFICEVPKDLEIPPMNSSGK